MKTRLLIVDDEPGLCDMLADYFRLAGYEVETALDGLAALRLLGRQKFDLVISDINMPHLNGFELVERLRAQNDDRPVIILSARSERLDVTSALRLGVDDYVAKPFGLEELSLRVAAVLRRTLKGQIDKPLLQCGPVSLDDERHLVTVNGQAVALSPTEFSLLKELMNSAGKVVSKSTLMRKVWNIGFQTDTNVLGTYISYLRKKLHTPEWAGIKTVRGLGFQIDEN